MAGSSADTGSFWETTEAVARFEARAPDLRMLELLEELAPAASIRVLDLGCAAGRNTVVLARGGYDVHAVDASRAMVARTRERLAEILGAEEAERRVLHGRMNDLRIFEDETFDLVLALGILHQAGSGREWRSAISEVARLLKIGGGLLVAAWGPRSRPDGAVLEPVPGRPNVYEGFHSGRHYLVDAGTLDDELAARHLLPVTPTREVEVEMGDGCRVTINGLYRKTTGSG